MPVTIANVPGTHDRSEEPPPPGGPRSARRRNPAPPADLTQADPMQADPMQADPMQAESPGQSGNPAHAGGGSRADAPGAAPTRRPTGALPEPPVSAVIVALLVLALLLAILSLASEAGRRAERRAVLEQLDGAGLPPARTVEERDEHRTEHWDEPARMRLEIARRIVNQALESPTQAATTLPLARRLAAEALAERPAAWWGPALVGTSLYLERSLAGDPRVVTEASRWEAPLAHARTLAPHALEPGRFQAIAYLELWDYLPPDRRREARTLLARAFKHPATFRRLLPAWLALAEDREEALSVIPRRAEAWLHLERQLTQQPAALGGTEARVEVRHRWRDALAAEMESTLAAARQRRRSEPYEARLLYLDAIATVPTESRFAPLVERALAEAPPGPPLSGHAESLERWLRWSLELDLVGAAPLSAAALDRLAGQVAELPAPLAAWAAVAAGHLPEGERLERRALRSPLQTPGEARRGQVQDREVGRDMWGGYRVAKARALAERGQGAEALATLDRLPPSWRDRPSALAARRAAARSAGRGNRETTATAALRRLAAGPAAVWLRNDPSSDGRWVAELVVDGDARSVEVRGRSDGAGAKAGLVELRVDGRLEAILPLRRGAADELVATVPLPPLSGDGTALPGEPRLHLLEIVPTDAPAFRPLAVRPLRSGTQESARQ